MKKQWIMSLTMLAFLVCPCAHAQTTDRIEIQAGKKVVADLGGVSAESPIAAAAGLEILRKGGNAVDAIVAAAFANAVGDHGMNGVGAYGGAMVVYLKKLGKPLVIDFTTRAPLEAYEDMYEVVPGRAGGGMGWWETKDNEQRDSYKSIAVPCGVAGLVTALEKYGTLPLKDVLAPAIRYAEEGFPISGWYANHLVTSYPRYKNHPATVAIFCGPGGTPLKKGDRLVQKDLAKTLRIIAEKGPDAFYRGELAQTMISHIRQNGGILSEKDFADWRTRLVRIEEPGTTTYRGYTLATPKYNTGGDSVLHILNTLEGYDLSGEGQLSAKNVHVMLEAMKLAFADRLAYDTSPEVRPVPVQGLLSKEYAAENRKRINVDMAMPGAKGEIAPGDPWKFDPGKKAVSSLGSGGAGGGVNTASTSAVDKDGNMVALTYTMTWMMGSGITVPGTGMLMNNGMMLFDPNPNTINSIKPGRLALNNMSSTVITKDGKAFMALGGSGGRAIITELVELIVNVIDRKMDIQDALSAPRFHAEDGEPCELEMDFPVGVAKDLEKMGHQFRVGQKWGGVYAILVDPVTGKYHIGCEPRALDQTAAGGLISN